MADGGYDVADPRDVDPLFGDWTRSTRCVAEAHALGLKVTVDVVPNHTSDRHPRFRGGPVRPAGQPRTGALPVPSRPAGRRAAQQLAQRLRRPAWSRELRSGEWYLHLFAPEQPDLNWRNPAVGDDVRAILRFWLDRGVDGFRIDVAHGLVKDAAAGQPRRRRQALRRRRRGALRLRPARGARHLPALARVLDSSPATGGHRRGVGARAEALARYVRPDELHLAFNFRYLARRGTPRRCGRPSTPSSPSCGRHAGDLGAVEPRRVRISPGCGSLGTRARAATLLMLALPGVAYLYTRRGARPARGRAAGRRPAGPAVVSRRPQAGSRDGSRVPIPWSGTEPPYGFGPRGRRRGCLSPPPGPG